MLAEVRRWWLAAVAASVVTRIHESEMAKLFPTLRYQDPRMAIGWLADALGFKAHFVAQEAAHIVHAQLRLGDQLIMLEPDHAGDRYGMHSLLVLNGTISACISRSPAGSTRRVRWPAQLARRSSPCGSGKKYKKCCGLN